MLGARGEGCGEAGVRQNCGMTGCSGLCGSLQPSFPPRLTLGRRQSPPTLLPGAACTQRRGAEYKGSGPCVHPGPLSRAIPAPELHMGRADDIKLDPPFVTLAALPSPPVSPLSQTPLPRDLPVGASGLRRWVLRWNVRVEGPGDQLATGTPELVAGGAQVAPGKRQ